MKIQNRSTIAPVLFLFTSFVSYAQGPPPPGLPIDSGLLLLAGIAATFGIYKIMGNKDQ